jgi:hypothetical protein
MAVPSQLPVDHFKELVASCISFYQNNKHVMSRERVRQRRAGLCGFVEAFHTDCGTLTPRVEKRIDELRHGNGIVLMTAHQPNLFPYSGLFRKATLNFVLAERLEDLLHVPVVNFFGIADQDFTDDRWVRECQLPAVQRREGIFSIRMDLPEKLMLNRVPKPSPARLGAWRSNLGKWLNDAIRSVERLCKELGLPELPDASSVSTLQDNLTSFWRLVEDCYGRSESYSDFNAFLISKIVNEVWGYDTVFSRFSDCQQAFVDEFRFLLSHFHEYSRFLTQAKQRFCENGGDGGVSDQEPLLAPFWYHCDCGSKVRLSLEERDACLVGSGRCVGCGEPYALRLGDKNTPDLSDIARRISARALSMALVFFDGLVPSCYVGGIAGLSYLMETEYVAKGLGVPFPPLAVWRPHDKYLGVGQIEAMLECRRICNDWEAHNISKAKEFIHSRISKIRHRLDELEQSKKKVVEAFRATPEDEALKEAIKRLSVMQNKIKRASNLSVISHELNLLENVGTVTNLIPSIIDYAVNIRLEEVSKQWTQYLRENGRLSSDVPLESILSRRLDLGPGLIDLPIEMI